MTELPTDPWERRKVLIGNREDPGYGFTHTDVNHMESFIMASGEWKGAGKPPLDSNKGTHAPYKDHIDLNATARDIQTGPEYKFSTAMNMNANGTIHEVDSYCPRDYKTKEPFFHTIAQKEYANKNALKEFNGAIAGMSANGGTHMYHGLLAAPAQFYNAKNKHRFIIVLSDGEESSWTFYNLAKKGMCKTLKNPYQVMTLTLICSSLAFSSMLITAKTIKSVLVLKIFIR